MGHKIVCQVIRKGDLLHRTAYFQVQELGRDDERFFVQFQVAAEAHHEAMVALTEVGDVLEFEISDETFSETRPLNAVSMKNISLRND